MGNFWVPPKDVVVKLGTKDAIVSAQTDVGSVRGVKIEETPGDTRDATSSKQFGAVIESERLAGSVSVSFTCEELSKSVLNYAIGVTYDAVNFKYEKTGATGLGATTYVSVSISPVYVEGVAHTFYAPKCLLKSGLSLDYDSDQALQPFELMPLADSTSKLYTLTKNT